jgi:hypothetical protein
MLTASRCKLLNVIAALRPSPSLAGHLNGRQKQADQDADDGDHHQKFYERETTILAIRMDHLFCSSTVHDIAWAHGIKRQNVEKVFPIIAKPQAAKRFAPIDRRPPTTGASG